MTEYLDRYPTMHEYAEGKRIDPKLTDYISRADAIEAVRSAISEEWLLREAIVTDIKALPSADAVHGEWKRLIEYVPESNESLINFDGYQCSVCGGKLWVDGFNFWNYCPSCGAIMKGGDDE